MVNIFNIFGEMYIFIIFYSTYSNKYTSQMKLKFNIIYIHMLRTNKFHIKPTKSYEKLTTSQKKAYYSHIHQKLIYPPNRKRHALNIIKPLTKAKHILN